MSAKLWHLLAVLLVIIVVMTVGVNNIFVSNAAWRTVSAEGFNTKVQTGLTQIFWQWQESGRPDFIEYRPENIDSSIKIEIKDDGIPKVIASDASCRDFLTWFLNDLIINKQVKVSSTNIWSRSFSKKNQDLAHNVSWTDNSLPTQKDFVCRYEYANHLYLYNTKTSEFTISKVE